MSVFPGEIVIHDRRPETARLLLKLAKQLGVPASSVRALEGAYAVPPSVAKAFALGMVPQTEPQESTTDWRKRPRIRDQHGRYVPGG